MTPFKTFVSYSWTSDDHANWVEDLASRLTNNGVEAILDRWYLKPGQDKYQFMEQMVSDPSVQKVLMICDKRYAEKANGREGGVGDETQIITAKIYSETKQTKFLPVIAELDENGNPYKPNYLKARMHIDLSNPLTFEQGYEDLLRDIVGKPLHAPPPLGKLPSYLLEDGGQQLSTAYKYKAFEAAVVSNKPTAIGAADDYLDALLAVLQPLGNVMVESGQQATFQELEEKILGNIELFLPYRDEFIEFVALIGRWGSSDRLFESLRGFFAKACPLMFTEYNNSGQVFPDAYQLLIPELFLYTIAALIRSDRFRETNILLGAAYPQSRTDPGLVSSYHALSPYMKNVDQWQSQRAGRSGYGRNTPTVQLLKQRATRQDITYNDLVETDYLLFIRSVFHPAKSLLRENWVPITIINSLQGHPYFSWSRGFPLFRRAEMHNDFEKLCLLLKVQDKADFVKKFETACNETDLLSANNRIQDKCTFHRNLICLDILDTVS